MLDCNTPEWKRIRGSTDSLTQNALRVLEKKLELKKRVNKIEMVETEIKSSLEISVAGETEFAKCYAKVIGGPTEHSSFSLRDGDIGK